MTKDELVKLAARCEAASGPDRELDREIAISVGHPWDYVADWGLRGHERPTAFPYTASIDAAMTLVPEECWEVGVRATLGGKGFAYISAPRAEKNAGHIHYGANAATPALALCAAALRATTTGEAK